jgi:hypothetical protein
VNAARRSACATSLEAIKVHGFKGYQALVVQAAREHEAERVLRAA